MLIIENSTFLVLSVSIFFFNFNPKKLSFTKLDFRWTICEVLSRFQVSGLWVWTKIVKNGYIQLPDLDISYGRDPKIAKLQNLIWVQNCNIKQKKKEKKNISLSP